MSLDAMKQALEALESNPDAMVDRGDGHWDFKRDLAITALRAAIEQAEKQEPVAWMWADGTITNDPDRADGTWKPLYTAPRQWQGLTDKEIDELALDENGLPNSHIEFARAIEAKLREKNRD